MLVTKNKKSGNIGILKNSLLTKLIIPKISSFLSASFSQFLLFTFLILFLHYLSLSLSLSLSTLALHLSHSFSPLVLLLKDKIQLQNQLQSQAINSLNKRNITAYFENLTVELHVLYALNTHVKFCVNRILFNISSIILYFMYNFKSQKLAI